MNAEVNSRERNCKDNGETKTIKNKPIKWLEIAIKHIHKDNKKYRGYGGMITRKTLPKSTNHSIQWSRDIKKHF